MRIVVFDDFRVGALDDEGIRDLTGLVADAPPYAVTARVNAVLGVIAEDRDRVAAWLATQSPVDPALVQLRAPCPAPRNFLAAPLNYRAHGDEVAAVHVTTTDTARELGFFVKATGSISGPEDPIELPPLAGRRFDHEAEIGVVIGRPGRAIDEADALDHVLGYTLVVDATMRMTEADREERPMRKSFATFAPTGPWIVTADEAGDPASMEVRCWVNGDLRQDGRLADLIVSVPELIARASRVVPLETGDLYATGTPAGIGPIEPGDRLTIESPQVGRMDLAVTTRAW